MCEFLVESSSLKVLVRFKTTYYTAENQEKPEREPSNTKHMFFCLSILYTCQKNLKELRELGQNLNPRTLINLN